MSAQLLQSSDEDTEMIDYYDVSSCYIFRPVAYSIWNGNHTAAVLERARGEGGSNAGREERREYWVGGREGFLAT